MTTLHDAARMAIDAISDLKGYRDDIDEAIAALREALNAPEPEPVARFINTATQGQKPHWEQVADEHANDPDVMPLYAAPPAAPAPVVPEMETRADGKLVRVDRWEWGIRRIVALLWGNRKEFEIEEVVQAIKELVPYPHEDDESLLCTAVERLSVAPVVPLTDEQKQRIHNETGAGHSLICLVESYIRDIDKARGTGGSNG